jgi:hypothetical protein
MQSTCARHHRRPDSAEHVFQASQRPGNVEPSPFRVRTGIYEILLPSRPLACHKTSLTRNVTTPASRTLIRIPECLAAFHLESHTHLCLIYRVFRLKLYTIAKERLCVQHCGV